MTEAADERGEISALRQQAINAAESLWIPRSEIVRSRLYFTGCKFSADELRGEIERMKRQKKVELDTLNGATKDMAGSLASGTLLPAEQTAFIKDHAENLSKDLRDRKGCRAPLDQVKESMARALKATPHPSGHI